MAGIKILWADDEIEMLKPQLFFLEKKGYEVITVSNGYDALDELKEQNDIDVVFLDESMPGITGLETLTKIKESDPNIPIVMITKNEAENLMEEAIGSQIDDYLIKPVNPNQILLTLKKIVDNKRLVSEKTASDYQQEFRKILMDINSGLDVRKSMQMLSAQMMIDPEIHLSRATDSLNEDGSVTERTQKFLQRFVADFVDFAGRLGD